MSAEARPVAMARTWPTSPLWSFLATPVAWVMVLGICATMAAEAHYRHGHYDACAAGSMLVDRQIFRKGIMSATRSELRFIQSCLDVAVPQTWDVARARRLLEEQPKRLFDWM
ncbi:MAG: hypothetical protein O2905_06355 [Proteobacteria bacterium]|nr:hypothetical protein [Pseudomonadota bacterium]